MKKFSLQLQVQMFFFVKWNSWSLFTNKSKLFARCWRARWTIKDLDSVLEQPGWGWSMSFWDFLFLGLFTGLRGRGACFFQDKHKQTGKMSTHPNVNLFSFSDLWISNLYKTIYWPTMHHLKLIFSQYATCNFFSKYVTFKIFFWKANEWQSEIPRQLVAFNSCVIRPAAKIKVYPLYPFSSTLKHLGKGSEKVEINHDFCH